MQIHQVEVFETNQHVLDPTRGMLLRKEQQLRRGSAASISHPDHEEDFEIGPDGTFDVPTDVALFYVGDGSGPGQPGWYAGPNPFHEEEPKQVEKAKASAAKG